MQGEHPVNGERHSELWGGGAAELGLRLLISLGWSGVAQPRAVGLALEGTFCFCRDRRRVITGSPLSSAWLRTRLRTSSVAVPAGPCLPWSPWAGEQLCAP